MTPKEKADSLYDIYKNALNIRDMRVDGNPFVKQCAIICVDEVINYTLSEKKAELAMIVSGIVFPSHWREYWEDVKKEIEKL